MIYRRSINTSFNYFKFENYFILASHMWIWYKIPTMSLIANILEFIKHISLQIAIFSNWLNFLIINNAALIYYKLSCNAVGDTTNREGGKTGGYNSSGTISNGLRILSYFSFNIYSKILYYCGRKNIHIFSGKSYQEFRI